MSNFDDLSGVVSIVKIKSKALFIGPYTDQQQRLFDRVSALREREKLTFDAIAKLLTRSGARSARGCLLAAEHVFSIYKKGMLRAERLAGAAEIELAQIGFVGKRCLHAVSSHLDLSI